MVSPSRVAQIIGWLLKAILKVMNKQGYGVSMANVVAIGWWLVVGVATPQGWDSFRGYGDVALFDHISLWGPLLTFLFCYQVSTLFISSGAWRQAGFIVIAIWWLYIDITLLTKVGMFPGFGTQLGLVVVNIWAYWRVELEDGI